MNPSKIVLLFLLLISQIGFADLDEKEVGMKKEEGSLNECQELFRDCMKDECEDLGGTPEVQENETHYTVKCHFEEENVFLETYFYGEDRETASGQCMANVVLPCLTSKPEFYRKFGNICCGPSFIVGSLLLITVFRRY